MSWMDRLSRPDARMSNHQMPRPSKSVMGPGRMREAEKDKKKRYGNGLDKLRTGFNIEVQRKK